MHDHLDLCTCILLWNWSNDRLYTSMTRSSSRKTKSSCSLGVGSIVGGCGDWGMTYGSLGIKSTYSLCGSYSKNMSIISISCSICWASSWSCICSPSSSAIGCSCSSNYIYVVSSFIMPFLCYSSYFYFSSHSLILNSFSSFSFLPTSCSFSYASCDLYFSLFLHSSLCILFFLFSFVAKDVFMIKWSAFILWLFSPS